MLRVALAQIDPHVGNIAANTAKHIEYIQRARDERRADIVVFPELGITGYPPDDLLLRPGFVNQALRSLDVIAQHAQGITAVVGLPWRDGGKLYNTAVALSGGAITARYFKQQLPNYGVFDEKRYFTAGEEPCIITVKGVKAALSVCEDLWHPGVMSQAYRAGGRLMLNLNASPYHMGKNAERQAVLRERTGESAMSIVYVNTVGGQDELVFDGTSLYMDKSGRVQLQLASCQEDLGCVDLDPKDLKLVSAPAVPAEPAVEETVYQALVLGIRDYVLKNGFRGVVLGLSGGIDSALTLALACDALGREQVEAVMMPSQFTAAMSLEDASAEAEKLGVHYREIAIDAVFHGFLDLLKNEFAGRKPDVTEENIQARCRGLILMAISNKKRKLVLTTGNKSEMAVGYATLYGDMAGGFAPLKDVPKLLVYRLARYRNEREAVIPERVLARAPSAELAPNQRDEDSLPPYSTLDPILELYVEQELSVRDIVARGFDMNTVERVVAMVDRNEYKRRQAPPGIKIRQRAFGRDRRYPITNGFVDE